MGNESLAIDGGVDPYCTIAAGNSWQARCLTVGLNLHTTTSGTHTYVTHLHGILEYTVCIHQCMTQMGVIVKVILVNVSAL